MVETIKLNLIPGSVSPIVHASQYDNNRTVRIMLYEGSSAYTLSNELVSIRVRKPDGNFITATASYTTGNNYVDVLLTTQMCAVAGRCLCNLEVAKTASDIRSGNFVLNVDPDPLDGAVSSESQINDLNDKIDRRINQDLLGFDATLTAGSTTVTITDEEIVTGAIFDVYTNLYDLEPTDIAVTTGQIVLTFDAQAIDVLVKVKMTRGDVFNS